MLDLDALEALDRALTDPANLPAPRKIRKSLHTRTDATPEALCPHLARIAAE